MAESRTDPIWHDRLRQPPRSAKAARVQDLLKRFEASQWRDPEDIAAAQFKQLSQVVSHAKRTIPHYAKTLGHVDSTDAKSLQSGRWLDLPVLERETVNQLGDGLLSRDVPKSHGRLDSTYTSGTTGRPLRAVRTSHALDYWSAFTTRDHIWHNRNIEGTLAAIRPLNIETEKYVALYPEGARHVAWGAKDGVIRTGPSVTLNVNTSIPDMAEWIARVGPDHLLSMPNIVRRLAPYCLENGITFPTLNEVGVLGEMCGDLMRQHCMEAWTNTPVHDMYSCREVGYIALQCPIHDHYHIQSEAVYLEGKRSFRPWIMGPVKRISHVEARPHKVAVFLLVTRFAMPAIVVRMVD